MWKELLRSLLETINPVRMLDKHPLSLLLRGLHPSDIPTYNIVNPSLPKKSCKAIVNIFFLFKTSQQLFKIAQR